MIYCIYMLLSTKYATWSMAAMGTGPNDTAIGKFFYKFLHVFYILINDLLYLHAAIYEIRDMEYGGNKNGPKRC